MNKEKNNMDDFLRGSLDGLKVQPSQNVWKKVSKRLLILELVRFNFTNIGKSWLYSGLAVITTIAGLTYYQMRPEMTNAQNTELDISAMQKGHTQQNIQTKAIADIHEPENKLKKKNTPNNNLKEKEETLNLIQKDESEIHLVENSPTAASIIHNKKDQETNNAIAQEKPAQEAQLNQAPYTNSSEIESVNKQPATHASNVTPATTFANTTTMAKQLVAPNHQTKAEHLSKMPPRYISSESNTLVIYMQGGKKAIPPLLINTHSTYKEIITTVQGTAKPKKSKTKPKKVKTKLNTDHVLVHQPEHLKWTLGLSYMPDWPLQNKDFMSPSHQFALQGGMLWNNFEFNIGLGIRGDKTTARLENQYSSYDSIGYYYDIDYYETIPGNPDSIIIHYTTVPLYDTVNHTNIQESEQHSRWVVVPIEIGYEILKRNSFVIKAIMSTRIGWEYYRETIIPNNLPSIDGFSSKNIGASSISPFITLGLGVEAQFKIYKNWWFIAEPRGYYYLKAPYQWKDSKTNGPFSIGVKLGVKFKF